MDTPLREHLLKVIGLDTWVQLDNKDVRMIRPDLESVFLRPLEDCLQTIWQDNHRRIWEYLAPYPHASLKKVIIQSINDPTYRGSLTLKFAKEKLGEYAIPVFSIAQIVQAQTTLNEMTHESSEPTSPNSQS